MQHLYLDLSTYVVCIFMKNIITNCTVCDVVVWNILSFYRFSIKLRRWMYAYFIRYYKFNNHRYQCCADSFDVHILDSKAVRITREEFHEKRFFHWIKLSVNVLFNDIIWEKSPINDQIVARSTTYPLMDEKNEKRSPNFESRFKADTTVLDKNNKT